MGNALLKSNPPVLTVFFDIIFSLLTMGKGKVFKGTKHKQLFLYLAKQFEIMTTTNSERIQESEKVQRTPIWFY